MRTIDQCAAYLRAADPDTALTKTALRRLVRSGALPAIQVGNKYLIALENLELFCTGGYTEEPETVDGVRRVH
jgi:excisionase family DNA binding protein